MRRSTPKAIGQATEETDPAEKDAGGLGRRKFLTWVVTGTTLTMAARLGVDTLAPATAHADELVDLGDALVVASLPTALDMVIEVTQQNRIIVQMQREETGQGISTAIAMLVADEMGARLADLDVIPGDALTGPGFRLQLTGGSNTMRAMYLPTRIVSAGLRARLITAAAERWNLPAHTLQVRDTMVVAPDGRTATFGSLSAAAAQVLLPAVSAAPKPSSEFTIVGRPTANIRARKIVTGQEKYTLDLLVPGALPTVVARPPTIGGTVASVGDTVARGMPGVVGVTRIPTGVAVTARTFHEAFKARDALQITWNAGPAVGLSDADIRARLSAAVPPFLIPPLPLVRHLDATFDFAYVSHSPMEVKAAIADVRPDRAEMWLGTQVPLITRKMVAAAVGLPESDVTVHIIPAGGAFGQRLFTEQAVEAALVSKAIGRPVKLMWSRSDDMRHGRFRHASHQKVRATYLDNGTVLTYEHRLATPRFDLSHGLGEALTAGGFAVLPGTLNQVVFQGTQRVPYAFGVVTQLLAEIDLPIPNGSWRSVYSAFASAVNETMVDEIARSLRRDPVAFRRAKLTSNRLRTVLDIVASAGQWGRPMPPGHAQGVGVHEEYKSAVAYLVELDTTGDEPRATRVVVAVDVGMCLNPQGLKAQMEGCLVDALSTVFWAGNHIDNGAVREGSFADFRYGRMRSSPPEFVVHIHQGASAVGGAGELGYPAAAAAVANAYARATGTPVRRFPLFA